MAIILFNRQVTSSRCGQPTSSVRVPCDGQYLDALGLSKTSSLKPSSPKTPPRAPAQDGTRSPRRRSSASSGLSSASTADGEASPELPPLPAPRLPERVLGLLRTPPTNSAGDAATQNGDATHWGSPYPLHLRQQSESSSGTSEESPIHQLTLQTPFLRPVPLIQETQPEPPSSSISAAAAVLANRARRVAHGITEDWIRQHTAGGSDLEKRHWLSDGTGDSENSSLSGSFSGEEAAWLGFGDTQTPKASRQNRENRKVSRGRPRKQSSSETLKALLREENNLAKMASSDERVSPDGEHGPSVSFARPSTPTGTTSNNAVGTPKGENAAPLTPSRTVKRPPLNTTPRLKKKVPWKGKNIMVLLPRDEERGQPGKAPLPLNESAVNGLLRGWEQLGYNVNGFDLAQPTEVFASREQSMSKGAWPDFEDMIRERKQGGWKVLLPDLNKWKEYVTELQEAKLRALGVSFGDDDPPAPSISPASTMSRQASVTHYPPLPFSPPIPTSSASSAQAITGFPFPPPFSAAGSPAIPTSASPASFIGKFNPRASISIPSPHAWSPQMMLPPGHRAGSPSLANLAAMMSPVSPFSADGMGGPMGHQRHQSLQFPVLQHQFHAPARASPRLQDLREVEEEPPAKSPSKTPEPNFIRHNPSDSLQKEIEEAEYELEEAEYHLEEQMRSQLDNDQDYSPHNGNDTTLPMSSAPLHTRDASVQFAPQPPRFGGDANGLVLHHPRPHSRGHSLSQKYFTEDDVGQGGFRPTLQGLNTHPGEDSEIETNPSNLGTPIQAFDFSKLHQRSFSTASNPWTDNESGQSAGGSHQRRISHGSKPSLSKLNVEAPEFKFNPTSTFKPGQFIFSNNNFQPQPAVFNAGVGSANSSQFSFPTTATSSKINPAASVFSPRHSEFSFSSSGPKFRPDAPAFTPHSLSNSITSPIMSGAESGSNRGSSIFGNIDLSNADMTKASKKSKAIPIVRPSSRESQHDGVKDGPDGRLADESRVKRVRATNDDGDSVPLFADKPEEASPVPETVEKPVEEDAVAVEDKSFDESNLGQGDMTMSSTLPSEAADTKATSPTETSPDQAGMNWTPFEFNTNTELQSFNDARPFGEDTFTRGHKKSLSATANPFIPGTTIWGSKPEESKPEEENFADEPVPEVMEAEPTLPEEPEAEEALVPEQPEEAAEAVEDAATEPEEIEEAPIKELPREPSPAPAPIVVSGLRTSRFASPPPKPKGLMASRFAAITPDPEPEVNEPIVSPLEADEVDQSLPLPAENLSPLTDEPDEPIDHAQPSAAAEPFDVEPSMADIDAVMLHLGKNPDMGVIKTINPQPIFHPSPTRQLDLGAVTNSSPLHLPPQQTHFRSDAPSPSPRRYGALPLEPSQPILSTELEDPFLDPPYDGEVHRLNAGESLPASDWEGAFSEDEQIKLESRVNFFDGRVNDVVGGILAARLAPLEQTLETIRHNLAAFSRGTPSSRRERRSVSAEIKESDADDEDDDMPVPRRSMSPRRDRKLEQIRAAVLDAFAVQQRNTPKDVPAAPAPAVDNTLVLKALEDMKEQFAQTLHLDFRGEDLRNIVEEAVESRMPPTPQPAVDDKSEKIDMLQARVLELEQKLQQQQTAVETEVAARRAAEDRAAELNRELESAATKIEVEMMNKSALGQRISDLEDRTHHFEAQVEEEVKGRRAAEDRLSEVQRLLRISSEEEVRLREVVEDKDQKIKSLESAQAKTTMRLTLLEASQSNAQQSHSEAQNRINMLEVDVREARQEARNWRSEADRFTEMARRHEDDLADALGENKALHKLIDTLGTQLHETERVRENWRSKVITIQEEMARTAREIAEENARRAKREQELLARQEVLDARLQAEARTRERIETELERLEMGERQGMRAVAECKRLEGLLAELRTENGKLQHSALRFQAEFQEARESGAREVQRTRDAMQTELDSANYQVNAVRRELEDQAATLRAQLDQVRMDADTAKARYEMLLEAAQTSKTEDLERALHSKQNELEELERRHQNDLEDLQARYERQLNNTTEDAQRTEQNLLERLSISTSKTEHLQDRVAHLEEKLEIAKEAAKAAAQAAKSSGILPESSARARAASRVSELPEKISPQALRESIMVLQEQLQEREQRIEELEHLVSQADPDAEVKISKRDDEIIWLRELLAVRHSDLQDIILALQRDDFDRVAVKDAAIRLKANLQMEEQERERAMNGGSAINLPNIAATIRDAATPRVAQAVGPLAAAWGNWRKARDPAAFGSLSSVLSSPATVNGRDSTPSKSSSASNNFLGGLLTPPASGIRQTPPAASAKQPTAFSSTGRRFTSQDLANRPRGISSASTSSRQESKMAVRDTPPRRAPRPVTPPMMRPSAYDSDAQAAEDFDDAGFFDD
ncbi:hypothetical protein QBC47DRAFT_441212 [Echria macrotheca]|uniref:Myosin class II heavy chain n=1 Tax=Echria macrotheca TaxID=438768 RepID=A0AAJ0FE93_9PEZI|nr:hypothetical protein QBC47DRAFT_441212 [Echria macrotheca]